MWWKNTSSQVLIAPGLSVLLNSQLALLDKLPFSGEISTEGVHN